MDPCELTQPSHHLRKQLEDTWMDDFEVKPVTETQGAPNPFVILVAVTVPFMLAVGVGLLMSHGSHDVTSRGPAFLGPLTYLLGLCALAGVLGQKVIPYPFPAPSAMGLGARGSPSGFEGVDRRYGVTLAALNRILFGNRCGGSAGNGSPV